MPESSSNSRVLLRDPLTKMEGPGADENMDFESGIDLWIIDKDEMLKKGLVGSSNIVASGVKAMNKENIKTHNSANKSLQYFRSRKRVNYQEISSDSEGDSSKYINDLLDPTNITKFDPIDISSSLYYKRSSTSSVNDKKKQTERLSSEEKSRVLTEGSSSSDTFQEKYRETLLSIENVGSSDKNGDLLVSSRSSIICTFCSYSCNNVEELRSHEAIQHNDIFNESRKAYKIGLLESCKTHSISEDSTRLNGIWKQSKNKGQVLRRVSDSEKGEKYSSKNYCCHICCYSFQDQLAMKTHQILFHSEMKVLRCEYCKYTTSQCANLATHIRVHFLLTCPYCDFHSSFKTSFKNHLLIHNNQIAYKCKKCPYQNRSKFLFKKHIKLHEHTAGYKCGSCNKVFDSNKILQRHKRKHKRKEKLFKCCYCSLSFSGNQSLRAHEQSHKPMHVCSVCNLNFTKKSMLETHIKVHNKNTFICFKCGSGFQRKYLLIRHMSEHDPDITECQHCSLPCLSPDDLAKHNCVNKLYNVQKRSLNFKHVSKSVASKKPSMKEKKKKTKLTNRNKVKSNPISDINGKTKKEDSTVKVLSRGKSLPSGKCRQIFGNRPNIHKIMKGCKQNAGVKERKETTGLKLVNEGTLPESRLRKRPSNNQHVIPPAKKIRKNESTNHLDIAKILFGKKANLVVEVSYCSHEGFIDCSKHNHTAESHFISKNQNNLRSCEKCLFKTNNEQLLEEHIKKAHMWSPEIINTFFY